MLGFLGDLLGLNQGDPLIEAAGKNRGVISGFDSQGNRIIDQGASQAGAHLNQISDLYSPLAKLATGTANLYGDALEVNGAAGNARATSAYQESPGYQHALNSGLQAIERRGSALGRFQSGGTETDLMDYAIGSASQGYGSWLERLANPGSTISNAIPGQATAFSNLANLATGTADARLGLAGNIASASMGANNQTAEGESSNKAGLSNLFGNVVGFATGGGFGGFGGKEKKKANTWGGFDWS